MSSKQLSTDQSKKCRSEIDQQLIQSKAHIEFWKRRLVKRYYIRQGQKVAIPDWQVRVSHAGKQRFINLRTTNKAAAANKARDIYFYLIANGWDATNDKFKPQDDFKSKKSDCTVGDFLAEIKAKTGIKDKTLKEYAKYFRQIVAEIHGIKGGKEKHDYVKGGRQKWLSKIESVKLSKISPEKIQKWKVAYMAKAGKDPMKQESAKATVNKIIRNAKSLFSKKVLRFVELELPRPLPFDDIEFEKEGSHRFHSEIDPELLLVMARNELSEDKPEQYKILLLALLAGLRRNEIDKLEWSSIDFDSEVISIKTTRYFQPKSEDSVGEVEVDLELMDILRGYYSHSKDCFVINSEVEPNIGSDFSQYRCGKNFNALNKWLRSKGITASNPLHSLRKEFGSLINAKAGIFEASRALRHSSTQVTERHYLDSKRRVTAGLGHLLKKDSIKLVGRKEDPIYKI